MSKIFTIAKGEFYRYFISPLAYVYLVCFLLLNASVSLYFGGVFSLGNASLRAMFEFLPWLYLLFVPGIAMRLWSEELKSGTILQIVTLPVSINDFIWGKFLAAWLFCGVALFLTFPLIITINILGEPDNWVIFNSYIGAFLLAGAMLSVSQTASALTKNQVIALVISVFLNLLFFLSGLEYVLSYFRGIVPEYMINLISSFSFLTHLHSFISGLLGLNSLVFFASLIFMFNFFTFVIINYKTTGTAFWLHTKSMVGYISAVVLVFVIFVSVNLFSDGLLKGKQIDFTEEKLFTLSSSTTKVLKNIEYPVTLRVYYSPILGERDERYRRIFDNLKILLDRYVDEADGNFNYQIYNPEPLSDVEDRAIASDLQQIAISNIDVAAYFGLVFSDEDGNISSVPFIPLQRANLLEQDLTEKIYLLGLKKKKIGLLTSLPMLSKFNGPTLSQSWQIADEISKFYNIKEINAPKDIDNSLDVLMIAHPKEMSEDMEEAIYNYSISGGKVLAFFDVAPEALFLVGPQNELMHQSVYGNLPKKWGFHYYDNYVVADLDYSSQVAIQEADYSSTTQDLIQFFVTDKGFYSDMPEVYNLKRMLMTSASIFRPLKNADIYFIPLMEASKNSQLVSSQAVIQNVHPAEILRRFEADDIRKPLAVHILNKDKNKQFEIIAVGDSDMLYDSFWTSSITIGNNNYNIPHLDNGNFVLNSLDVLTGNDTLIDLRGKSPKIRPFEGVERRQKQSLIEFKIKEKDIFDQINLIKKGLAEVNNKKAFEGRENFTADELAVLNKVKTQLDEKRKELYEIRLELNDNMQRTDALVKFFNIYAIPLLVIVGFVALSLKKISFCKPQKPKFNKRFWIMAGVGSVFVILGVVGVCLQPEVYDKDFIETPMFNNLNDKINDVASIVLQNHDSELVFYKKDNMWFLKGKEEFLVKQNRISNLLAAIVRASVYEKKSSKAESMKKFGLLPIENSESTAIKVTLKNDDEEDVVSFEVGDYDVDLSRSAKGAYIRILPTFEVWLAKVAFIDLGLDYSGWIYDDLWNLQFGRMTRLNGENDVDKIANTVSTMLNIKTSQIKKENIENPSVTLTFSGEDFEKLVMTFYKKKDAVVLNYNFDGDIKNEALKAFAKITEKNSYEISLEDMEKINNAVKPR